MSDARAAESLRLCPASLPRVDGFSAALFFYFHLFSLPSLFLPIRRSGVPCILCSGRCPSCAPLDFAGRPQLLAPRRANRTTILLDHPYTLGKVPSHCGWACVFLVIYAGCSLMSLIGGSLLLILVPVALPVRREREVAWPWHYECGACQCRVDSDKRRPI